MTAATYTIKKEHQAANSVQAISYDPGQIARAVKKNEINNMLSINVFMLWLFKWTSPVLFAPKILNQYKVLSSSAYQSEHSTKFKYFSKHGRI